MPSSSPIKQLISSSRLRQRYNNQSLRTLRRWELRGTIPPPDRIIHGRKYWWLETLERHERELVAQKSTAPSSTRKREPNSPSASSVRSPLDGPLDGMNAGSGCRGGRARRLFREQRFA